MMVYYSEKLDSVLLVMPVVFDWHGFKKQGYEYEDDDQCGFVDEPFEKYGWIYVGDAD